jgi:hypothetical protein
MTIFYYILIALASIYIGKYEKRVNVALIAAPISIPLGIMTAVGLMLIFKALFILLALLLAVLSNLKIFVKLKIGAVLGSVAAAMFASLAGPIGWVISILLLLFIVSAIKEMFVSIYEWFFRKMAQVLMWIRGTFDSFRRPLPVFFHLPICIIEAAIVCGLSLKGLWEFMDWVDGKAELTPFLIKLRLLIFLPYLLILYRNYIKDTTPPNAGGDGVDSPVLVEFVNIVDAVF